jgi:hypothetical protein
MEPPNLGHNEMQQHRQQGWTRISFRVFRVVGGYSFDFPRAHFGRMSFAAEKDWASEQPPDWGAFQPLPFPYLTSFQPKYLIDNPECKRKLVPAIFKRA